MYSLLDKFKGCLLGLATGDAIGTTLEFAPRGSFQDITDMIGGGPFHLEAGEWTDDTSMALCLAHSLLHCEGFDATDQMNRYCNWRNLGYMSSNGRCFDIGNTVTNALNKYLDCGDPYAGSSEPETAGNGSIMRLAPVAMYYYPDTETAKKFARHSSMTTHGADECLDACQILTETLCRAFKGGSKQEVVSPVSLPRSSTRINQLAQGDWQSKQLDQIRGTGYVVESLEAALWCFANTESFSSCVLRAANLGDDADTTAAIAGQIAGAFYATQSIPAEWLAKLVMKTEIEELAVSLHDAG